MIFLCVVIYSLNLLLFIVFYFLKTLLACLPGRGMPGASCCPARQEIGHRHTPPQRIGGKCHSVEEENFSLHGLPRRFAPRSDETAVHGPFAVFVARNHVHSSPGAPTTHAGWWIGRPGVGPIRRCHRACVPITVLMSTSRCASSARRRAWARERMSGPPALPHSVEKGVFLRLHRGCGLAMTPACVVNSAKINSLNLASISLRAQTQLRGWGVCSGPIFWPAGRHEAPGTPPNPAMHQAGQQTERTPAAEQVEGARN